MKECAEFVPDQIDISTTACYTPEDKDCTERISRIIKIAVRTMLIHSGTSPDLCVECLYAVSQKKILKLDSGALRYHRNFLME